MNVIYIDKKKELEEKTELKAQCKMCKEYFSIDVLKMNKCPECLRIYREWVNGRQKTPEEKIKYKGIRAHYSIPSYKKIYSVYQYDSYKYNEIWRKIQVLACTYDKQIYYNTNPYRVLELCYIRDNEGKRIHLKDEQHTYRYKALHRINALIAEALINVRNIPNTKEALYKLYKETGIIYYQDDFEPTADLEVLVLEPLRTRLTVASRLLRLLYVEDLSINQAVKIATNLSQKLPRDKLKKVWGIIKFNKIAKQTHPKKNNNKSNRIVSEKEHEITQNRLEKISKGYLIEQARQELYKNVKSDIKKGLRPCEIYKKYPISDGTYYRLKKEVEIESKQNKPRTKQEIQEKLGEIMGIEHFYRLKTLGKITTAIAKELRERYNLLICNDVINYLYKRTGIRYFKQEKTAEITAIYREAIKYRLEVHIALLRLLREGYEVEEIKDLIEWQYKISEV